MKILLAVDGSVCTKRMLAYLAAHEEVLGARQDYTALTVVAPVPPHVTRFIDHATLDDYYREQAELVLKPVVAFAAQQGWKLTPQHAVGSPGDLIAEAARSGKYEMVVIGSHGHTALGNVVLGSVATRVIAQCEMPVLVVR